MGLFDKLFGGKKEAPQPALAASDPAPAPAPTPEQNDPIRDFWLSFSHHYVKIEELLLDPRKGPRQRAQLEPFRLWLPSVDPNIEHEIIVGGDLPVEAYFAPRNMASYDTAVKLAACAPPSAHWKFFVYRPRDPAEMIDAADGMRIGVSALGFIPLKNENGGLTVIVVIPDMLAQWSSESKQALARAALVHVIGSRDALMWVRETNVVAQSGVADASLIVNGADFAGWFDAATKAR